MLQFLTYLTMFLAIAGIFAAGHCIYRFFVLERKGLDWLRAGGLQNFGLESCPEGFARHYLVSLQNQPSMPPSLPEAAKTYENARPDWVFLRNAPIIIAMLGGSALFYALASASPSGTPEGAGAFGTAWRSGYFAVFLSMVSAALLIVLRLVVGFLHESFLSGFSSIDISGRGGAWKPAQAATGGDAPDFSRQIDTASQSLGLLAEKLSADYEHLAQFAETFHITLKAYAQAQSFLQNDIAELTNITAGYKSRLDQAAGAQTETLGALDKLLATNQALSERLDSSNILLTDQLKHLIELTKAQQQGFSESMKGMVELSRSNLSKSQSASNRFDMSSRKFMETLERFDGQIGRLDEVLAQPQEGGRTQSLQITQRLDEMVRLLTQLHIDLPVQITAAAKNAGNGNASLNPETLEQMAHTIAEKKIAERLESYEGEISRLEDELEARRKQGGWLQNWLKQ